MAATTIILADDHQVVRQGLRALLEAEKDFQVIGETGDGLDALRLVERLRANVLIVDLMMPGLNGLELTRRVSRSYSETRVVILSMHGNNAYVLEGLRNGAYGYVLKDSSAADLVQAVREVTNGRRYLGPPLSQYAIESYISKSEEASLDDYETLTTREREVLQLAAEGRSNPEIARLFISPRTAETHRTNLMRKLGLRSRTDLVRYAIIRGIVPSD